MKNKYKNKNHKNKYISFVENTLIEGVEVIEDTTYEYGWVGRRTWGIDHIVNKYPKLPKKIITLGLYNRQQRKQKLLYRDEELLNDYINHFTKEMKEKYGISKHDSITIFKKMVTHYKNEKHIE